MADPTLPGQDVATIVATTLENIKPKLIDNLSRNDAFFFYLNQNERIDYEDGGYRIREPLLYGLNNTIQSYYPGEPYATERPTGFTSVEYEWGFVGGTIVIDGPTRFMNQGRHGIVNLVKAYIEQLKISFSQAMTTMFYADGTGNNGADLLGLGLLVEDGAAWSTCGGIDSNTYTWWRNQYTDGSASAWGADPGCFGIQTLKHYMRLCSKPGYGKPDVLLTEQTQYELYENAIATVMVPQMPLLQKEVYADAGFGGLRLMQVPVIWDENGTAQVWFLLNSKALRLVIGKNRAFDVSKPIEHPTMDAEIMKAKLYGQLTVRGRRDCLGHVKLKATYN